jgi:hypothetical protein
MSMGDATRRIIMCERASVTGAQRERGHHGEETDRHPEGFPRHHKLHLIPVFEGRRMVQIDKRAVQQYIVDRLDAGATNASINRELAIVEHAFTLAEIPRPSFRMLHEDNVRYGFFEAAQLAAVLSSA